MESRTYSGAARTWEWLPSPSAQTPPATGYSLEDSSTPLETAMPALRSETTTSLRIQRESLLGGCVEKSSSIPFNRSLATRNICIAGLLLSWAIAIACLVLAAILITRGEIPLPGFLLDRAVEMNGVVYPYPKRRYQLFYFLPGHHPFSLPKSISTLVPLLLNGFLTAVLDCMNYIHTTTLRWALWQERRLEFNSNPRLFVSSKAHGPNRWFTNALSAVSLATTYGAISCLTNEIYLKYIPKSSGMVKSYDVPGPRYGLDFNGTALLGFGIGLLLQAIVSTWSLLCRPSIILTWSSNPLESAKACINTGLSRSLPDRNPRPNTDDTLVNRFWQHPASPAQSSLSLSESYQNPSMMSLLEVSPLRLLAKPTPKQPSIRLLVPSARYISRLLWVLAFAVVMWAFTVLNSAIHQGALTERSMRKIHSSLDFSAYWSAWGQISIRYFGAVDDPRDWLGLIIQIAVQSLLTLALHCVELLTNFTRDEAAWRKATSKHGARSDENPVVEFITSWPAMILFVFKTVTQWVFGQAFFPNYALFMNLLPLITLAVLLILLAIFAECLLRYQPRGPQPATYGNLQALADLADEWDHAALFWGDKGEVRGVQHAGTARTRLPEIRMDSVYTGLSTQLYSRRAQCTCNGGGPGLRRTGRRLVHQVIGPV